MIHNYAINNTPVPSASNPFSPSDHFREKTDIGGAMVAVNKLTLGTQLLRINTRQPVKEYKSLNQTLDNILQNVFHGYVTCDRK
jgi:hypothetical protein